MTKETEEGFRGEYSFLSNFTYFETPWIVTRGDYKFIFVSNEHFYQACKFTDLDLILKVSEHPAKGLKKFVGTLKEFIREDWAEIKTTVMKTGLDYKFSAYNPKLCEKLLNTGDIKLVEYNWWGDIFLGCVFEK
jgi:predicted NAD-dependent protein-ADP-ribosyltransferase YbiA (DUF1768 family)